MDKHKEHHKSKEKEIHEHKDATKKDFDSSDAELEKKMKEEKAAEERRKTFRREADRIADEERTKAIQENQKLVSEMENLKDVMLRRQADFENYKKRMAKQQGESRKMAIKDFSHDIMDINDDLLRAIEASQNMSNTCSSEESHRSFVEGVSMISRRIEEAMKKYGVVEIEALNQEFNPNFHEAVEINSSDGIECDTVTKVYQKGFRIDDLVVRSAKVRVTKPMRAEPPAPMTDAAAEAGEDGPIH